MAQFVPRSIDDIADAFQQRVQEQKVAEQLVDRSPVAKEVAEPAVTPAAQPVPPQPEVETKKTPEPVSPPPAPPVESVPRDEADTHAEWESIEEETLSLDQINDQFFGQRSADEVVIESHADASKKKTPDTDKDTDKDSRKGETSSAEKASDTDLDSKKDDAHKKPEKADEVIRIAPDPAAQVAAFDTLKDSKRSGGWRKLLRFLGIVLWIATVLGLILSTIGFLTRDNPLTEIGDFGVYYQRTANMMPDIGEGSLIVARTMKPDAGASGDDIVFALDGEGTLSSVALRRVVNVLREGGTTTYDTIALADRENTHEQFGAEQALMKKVFSVPFLGRLIDWLTVNVWWIIGAFALSLFLVTVFRPRERD